MHKKQKPSRQFLTLQAICENMNQRRQHIAGIFLLLFLLSGCIYLRFPEYFKTPNSKVIEAWGDGYKTYMALIYHVKYDRNYSYLEAMNHPYGEHVVPGDAQPALSNTIRFISRNVVDISDYSIAILHFAMLGSLLLCGLFLYLIFRRLDVPAWYAMPVAIGLAFLSPQLERMLAHFGLAHPAMLPLTLYLLMRWEEDRRWQYSLLLSFVVLFYAGLHFYFYAILAFTIGGYLFFSLTQKRDWSNWWRYGLHFSLQLLLPLLFYIWWMDWNDPVTDRPGKPWGYLAHRAHWEGVFLSLKMPLYNWIDQHLLDIRKVNFESLAYVGTVGFVASLIFLVRWLRQLLQRPPWHFGAEVQPRVWLNATFYTAVCILLFSFGLPFTIKGLEPLLDYTGPLQQFRSIGRFAWVFFYVINIIAFAGLYHWAKRGTTRRWLLPALALLMLGYETWHYNRGIDLALDTIDELKPGRSFAEAPGIDFNNYQATVPIPYYNIGSDNFWWGQEGFIGQKVESIAIQTGLPTTGAMLTRTSISQTINQLQLILEPYRHPRLLDDLPNDKPLLLAWDSIRVQNFPGRYEHLLEEVTLAYQRNELQLYEMPLSTFETRIERRKQTIRQTLDTAQLYPVQVFLSTDSSANFVYQSWDTLSSDRQYFGNGSYQGFMNNENIVYEGMLPAQTGDWYLFSIWMFLNEDLYPRTRFEFIEYHPDGSVLQHARIEVRDIVRTFDNNGWGLLELGLKLNQPDSRLRFRFFNTEIPNKPLWLDELLIRPVQTNLYRADETLLWWNNRWWENK